MRAEIESLIAKANRHLARAYLEKTYQIWEKSDSSPVTTADMESNEILVEGLKDISPGVPVVSEELDPVETFPNLFWIIDPLDGTRDFVERTGDFAINVALVENFEPIFSAIGHPLENQIFCAEKGRGVHVNNLKLERPPPKGEVVGVMSHFSSVENTKRGLKKMGCQRSFRMGSSLKFCSLAKGDAHIYLRLGPTKCWDLIAGQLIVEELGCKVVELNEYHRLSFPKQGDNNPSFIAYCPEIENHTFTQNLKSLQG